MVTRNFLPSELLYVCWTQIKLFEKLLYEILWKDSPPRCSLSLLPSCRSSVSIPAPLVYWIIMDWEERGIGATLSGWAPPAHASWPASLRRFAGASRPWGRCLTKLAGPLWRGALREASSPALSIGSQEAAPADIFIWQLPALREQQSRITVSLWSTWGIIWQKILGRMCILCLLDSKFESLLASSDRTD